MFENHHRSRIVYLLKIGAKSFRNGSQDIFKDTESNLGPFAGLKAEIIQKQALFQLAKNNYELELELIMQSALFFLLFSFLARQGHFFV